MNPFDKALAEAERGRQELKELASDVTSGMPTLPPGMSPSRALEILNGCIGDYGTIIKRLGGRHRG